MARFPTYTTDIQGYLYIDGINVCRFGKLEQAQNVAMKCRAHDELVAALEEHDRVAREYNEDAYTGSTIQSMTLDALAKARGEA